MLLKVHTILNVAKTFRRLTASENAALSNPDNTSTADESSDVRGLLCRSTRRFATGIQKLQTCRMDHALSLQFYLVLALLSLRN